MAQHFGQSHHRELLRAGPGLAAGGDHLRSGDPEALQLWGALAQRRDERGAELISGRFPRDDADAQRRRAHHLTMLRVELRMKSTNRRSSGRSAAEGSSRASASLSFRSQR
jgi:hypothetical protein